MFLDQAKTDAEREALRLMLARLEYGRPFFLPPNVPAERVEALRRAFDATMKDPAYLAEADKLKIDVDPLTGEQVAALVEQVSRTDRRYRRPRARGDGEQIGRPTCGDFRHDDNAKPHATCAFGAWPAGVAAVRNGLPSAPSFRL